MRDPDAMAQAILDMLDHPPDKERLRRAAAPYTVENSARRYLEVLLGKAF
jgi:glycosyltransferase involved in cell wall biosynthesis